ncbi:dual specificity calcium/calmodulin-dependent 3',5'-cyclic nucleotide phosphodiesterase 1-like isoform X3 [Macrosteles quadrilineatus]|uniref:dual specificity calcium/calmodulin-dependent 3',5'-cyclic nucleotide phosphodiesterase 1-like isoform X3 n=1 Tax=Macrosteles quadrilineatus TaxID=74068 RepID=UPI0023E2C972|nr:dual specificity calcium/calmodulin-dependent 3',5'-cyclic nucleotide phosphodiesterase 1-like isoform X3 [Macrosteles quadrilineatus]
MSRSPDIEILGEDNKRFVFSFRLQDPDQVASPPERPPTKEDAPSPTGEMPSINRNGQLSKQGSLTIVRRSSAKKQQRTTSEEESVDSDDLTTDNLPAIDTPDACDKAAARLRCLLKQLERGEISADVLQKNLQYAARVLEAVFIDETKRTDSKAATDRSEGETTINITQRKLKTPVWAVRSSVRKKEQGEESSRRLADEDDELSEVQPDAVPAEVREWLTSTFTRQLAPTRCRKEEKPKFRSVAQAIRAGIFVDRIYRRMAASGFMQFSPEIVEVLKSLDDWSFDVFSLGKAAQNQPVRYLGYDLLNRYGCLSKFKISLQTIENFLNRVEQGYLRYGNPYHNNLHAADVAQSVHYMLCQTGLMNWMTDLEIFATLIAALIHDYEHTGTTNNFHVMSGTDTALLYNDKAVLENHHLSASFRVLKEEDCNILSNMSREEYREFRSLVIETVLATDMSCHFHQLKNMKNLLSLQEPSIDKAKALSLVLHCCDISHPAKKWDLHFQWTSLLLEEFFLQGDREKELGLPFSPLCDRKNTLVAESQIGFIEFIVDPSMSVCSDMLEAILAPVVAPAAAKEVKRSVSVSEDTRKHHEQINCDDAPPPFTIKKPWLTCLAENKKIWKERAVIDAAARAAAEAAAAAEAEEEERRKQEEEGQKSEGKVEE